MGFALGNRRRRIEAAGGKFEYGPHLLSGDMKLFDDLLNTRPGFEIFKDGVDRHPGVAKHPGAGLKATSSTGIAYGDFGASVEAWGFGLRNNREGLWPDAPCGILGLLLWRGSV